MLVERNFTYISYWNHLIVNLVSQHCVPLNSATYCSNHDTMCFRHARDEISIWWWCNIVKGSHWQSADQSLSPIKMQKHLTWFYWDVSDSRAHSLLSSWTYRRISTLSFVMYIIQTRNILKFGIDLDILPKSGISILFWSSKGWPSTSM